jgi:hypothetical protein
MLPALLLLLVVGVGVLALVLNWCFVNLAARELQQAADAAALAAAGTLAESEPGIQCEPIGVHQRLREAAVTFASQNAVAGRPAIAGAAEPDEAVEILVGRLIRTGDDRGDIIEDFTQPDTVRVTLRRSRAMGNPLPLLFSVTGGRRSADLAVLSQATLDDRVLGLRPTRDIATPLVPLAILDDDATNPRIGWRSAIVAGLGQDRYGFDRVTGRIRRVSDGVPEIVLRAGSGQADSPGNLLALRLGGASPLRSGFTRRDLEPWGGELIAHPAQPLALPARDSVDPGVFSELRELRGTVRIWPLYGAAAHAGRAALCIGFVAARIMHVGQDESGQAAVTLQPALWITPTAVTSDDETIPRNGYIRKLRLSN